MLRDVQGAGDTAQPCVPGCSWRCWAGRAHGKAGVSEHWVCSVPGRVCVVSTAQTQPDRACGRAAASPRPPSTAGQIHLFIAITPGLCDPAALGLCLGKRLCWEGAKRVLCGFPWKPEHEDGSSSQALLEEMSRFNLVPSFPWY